MRESKLPLEGIIIRHVSAYDIEGAFEVDKVTTYETFKHFIFLTAAKILDFSRCARDVGDAIAEGSRGNHTTSLTLFINISIHPIQLK